MKPQIPRLHVITDEVFQTRFTHVELAEICSSAGADAIQYREKRSTSFAKHVAITRDMQACMDPKSLLVVNDFVSVAKEVGARAIHLGQEDETVASAREQLGDQLIIGATANSIEAAEQIDTELVDYIGIGPVFGTTSKANPAPVLGLNRLETICKTVDIPVVAIGNIQVESVAEVIDAGAHGVAVLSAIVCAASVRDATESFVEALNQSISS